MFWGEGTVHIVKAALSFSNVRNNNMHVVVLKIIIIIIIIVVLIINSCMELHHGFDLAGQTLAFNA
jgi:t-SNARE complex subunit (syntaxin)